MRISHSSRLPFLIASAIFAAALGDALTESVSNAGIFGRGYGDDNHLSVVPALIAAVLMASAVAGSRALEIVRHGRTCEGDWLLDAAREISSRSLSRDLPWVLALQIGVLFAMENAERLLIGGGLPGGTAWLGGPIAFALLTHACVGLGCSFALARATRALVETFASLVRAVVAFALAVLDRAGPRILQTRPPGRSFRRAQAPHVREIGGRAPPRLRSSPA